MSSITFEYDEAIFRGYSANLTPENLQFLLSHRDIEFISEDGICSAMVMYVHARFPQYITVPTLRFRPEDLEEVIEHEIVAAGEAASEDAAQTVDVYGLDTVRIIFRPNLSLTVSHNIRASTLNILALGAVPAGERILQTRVAVSSCIPDSQLTPFFQDKDVDANGHGTRKWCAYF